MQPLISLSSRRIITFLGLTALGFTLANLAQLYLQYGFQRSSFFGLGHFDLDLEASITTWFSSAQLLLCAILLGLIAQLKQTTRDRYRFHWAVLSAVFVIFSIDETAGFHERLIEPLRAALNTRGVLYFAWVIPAGFFVLAMLLLYRKFLLHLPANTRLLFLVAGGTYLMGAIGMEMLGAPLWEAAAGGDSLIKDLIIIAEEILELIGIQIFIYALLGYMGRHLQSVKFAIDADTSASMHQNTDRA